MYIYGLRTCHTHPPVFRSTSSKYVDAYRRDRERCGVVDGVAERGGQSSLSH